MDKEKEIKQGKTQSVQVKVGLPEVGNYHVGEGKVKREQAKPETQDKDPSVTKDTELENRLMFPGIGTGNFVISNRYKAW